MCTISVATASRNAMSCDTTTSIVSFNCVVKYQVNHTTAFKSQWFVGSSSSSTLGFAKSAHANASLLRHPPDSCDATFCCAAASKPMPRSIAAALDSAVSTSSASSSPHSSDSLSAVAKRSSLLRPSSSNTCD
jgi:hypothetical protein